MLSTFLPSLTPPTLLAIVTVCCAAATDLYSRTISNNLILAALLTALPLHLLALPWSAALQLWSTGALTGLLLFLPMYLARGMAAGDVKLLSAIGAFTGPAITCKIAIYTCMAGGSIAVAMILFNGKFHVMWAHIRMQLTHIMYGIRGLSPPPTRAAGESAGTMPYALAIAVGTLAVLGGVV